MQILLNYNPLTGEIKDSKGTIIFTWAGLDDHEAGPIGVAVKDLCELKDAGFASEEIIEMKRKGVL